MKLGTRLTIFGIVPIIIASALIFAAVSWQTSTIVEAAKGELQRLAETDLKNISMGSYNAVLCQDKTTDTDHGRRNTRELHDIIAKTTVGDTGYVWVLDSDGNYIVSKDGKRDGENIWNAKDPSGTFVIQEMIKGAMALNPGEVFTYRYMWKNPDDPEPRWKMAAVMYYEPWGWVIGASTYEDELMTLGSSASQARSRMIVTAGSISLLLCILTAAAFALFASGITRRLNVATQTANALAAGDIGMAEQILGIGSRS